VTPAQPGAPGAGAPRQPHAGTASGEGTRRQSPTALTDREVATGEMSVGQDEVGTLAPTDHDLPVLGQRRHPADVGSADDGEVVPGSCAAHAVMLPVVDLAALRPCGQPG